MLSSYLYVIYMLSISRDQEVEKPHEKPPNFPMSLIKLFSKSAALGMPVDTELEVHKGKI